MAARGRIVDFEDACAALRRLGRRTSRGHAAAIVAADGRVLDMHVFGLARHTAGDALGWAHRFVVSEPRAARIVLLSVGVHGLDGPVDDDGDLLDRASRRFGELGVRVVDWIQSDGVGLRSIAFLTGRDTWPRTSDRP